MQAITEAFQTVKKMDAREFAHQLLSLLLIVSSAIMIWKGLVVVTGSESPVVVVLSGSMEPAFYRGDILFLTRGTSPLEVGDIVVYKLQGRDIPIVHRILELRQPQGKPVEILTKGDNNMVHDRGLYNPGQLWLSEDEVMGRADGFLPYVGMVTIALTDYPILKYVLIGLMGFFVITSKEQ